MFDVDSAVEDLLSPVERRRKKNTGEDGRQVLTFAVHRCFAIQQFWQRRHFFLGCLSSTFVPPFIGTHPVTTMSHERLEQSRWNFAGKYPLPMTWLDGGQRSRSQQAVEIKSCEYHISWTTWADLMKCTRNNHKPPLITWSDVGRSKVKVTPWFKCMV